jgi:hypothetical protein
MTMQIKINKATYTLLFQLKTNILKYQFYSHTFYLQITENPLSAGRLLVPLGIIRPVVSVCW